MDKIGLKAYTLTLCLLTVLFNTLIKPHYTVLANENQFVQWKDKAVFDTYVFNYIYLFMIIPCVFYCILLAINLFYSYAKFPYTSIQVAFSHKYRGSGPILDRFFSASAKKAVGISLAHLA